LAVSSHVPPALSQLALSVAFVTSPAKAGPVRARVTATASVEIRVFMAFSLYAYSAAELQAEENSRSLLVFPRLT
jgi:hypothetical protein